MINQSIEISQVVDEQVNLKAVNNRMILSYWMYTQ